MKWSACVGASGICLGLMGVACSAQTDTEYSGEPLAVLRGTVITDETTTDEELVAAVVWTTRDGGTVGLIAAAAPLEGEFPANFKLELVAPPPPEAFHREYSDYSGDGKLDVAQGVIAAVPASRVGGMIKDDDIVGIAMDHGLVYFQQDAEFNYDPSWGAARSFNVEAVPGYHLFSIKRDVDEEYLECVYGGLCVQMAPSSAEDDYVFERCLSVIEDPVICTSHTSPMTDEEKAEDQACSELWTEMRPGDIGGSCGNPWSWPKNEDGLNAFLTITMGKGLPNWLND